MRGMRMNNQKKIVVFGGAGFLGSHVADALSDKGHKVFVFDKVCSPYLREGQEMIIGDVLNFDDLDNDICGADYVYNFAGIADIEKCAVNPVHTIHNNIIGHAYILEKCCEHQIRRIIFASSIYVYSKQGSFYKIAKQTCEHLTEEYYDKYDLPYTILRYGSLYGPRSQEWNGLHRYVAEAVRTGKIDYPGTGDEKREYIHVLDAARLSVDILTEKYLNKCVVITGTDILTSKDLLTMINEMLDNKISINYLNKKLSQHYTITPYSFIPKIGMKLQPNPSVDMGEGLLQEIEYIYTKEHL